MADVFMDARLPDYFSERGWQSISQLDRERDGVLEDFLSEKIALIHGVDLGGLDLAFLGQLSFPQNWEMKKFPFAPLLRAVKAGEESDVVRNVRDVVLGGDRPKFDHLIDQFAVLDRIVAMIFGRLFENTAIEDVRLISRFSETRMENLHYDMDANADDHEAFRLYINLDTAPRIWATSYQLTQLLEEGGERLVGGLDDSLPGETLLKRVVTRAFGGWDQRSTERIAPRHMAYFDPGDIWIVDGRTVAHQVLTGHRVLSVYAKVPHGPNPHIRPTFGEKIRSAAGLARRRPVGQETALVNYFTKSFPPVDIRADWSKTFGSTGTGRLRRFTDQGLIEPTS